MTTTHSVDPTQALRAAAAWGLPGAPDIELPEDPDSLATFARLAQQTQLIGPLLAAAAAGGVALSDAREADLVERQERALLWCIHLETRLLEVREWFDAAGGVEHLVIKGPAIAYLDVLNPSSAPSRTLTCW